MAKFLILSMLLCLSALAQDLEPGKDRWNIKTSVIHRKGKSVDLKDIMAMPMPDHGATAAYHDERMPTSFGDQDLHEGDIISTVGYIHIAAFEKPSDGDYHLQMTGSSTSGQGCFIVEIPAPEFVNDPTLKQQVTVARQFVRDRLCKGLEPTKKGRVMEHDVYVRVTGQLFADLHHLANYGDRGKQGEKSGTVWELHPVTKIEFVPMLK